MTKEEAIKAKKQLKDNVLPPAMSTRSHDRVLRKQCHTILIANIIIFYHEYVIILLYIIVQTMIYIHFKYMNMLQLVLTTEIQGGKQYHV